MPAPLRRAPFLSLDGLDGTGKSTQCRLLAEWLTARGLSVVTCADPGGTPLGSELRAILLQHGYDLALPGEAFLFMASRAQLVREVIRPALQAGRAVVCDRFVLANVVYQGHAGGLDIDLLWAMGRLATGGLEPDLTIVLDLSVAAAAARRGRAPDRMEMRGPEYQVRVRQGFLDEARRRPDKIRVVDALGNAAQVHERICQEVLRVVEPGQRS